MSHAVGDPDVPQEAIAIVQQFKEPITLFHTEVQGQIKAVHHLFNHIAMTNDKPPFTPPAIAMLAGITPEQLKSSSELGPNITVEQLMDAFAKLIPPGDTAEVFEKKVVMHIREEVQRLRHARIFMPEVKPLLEELHTAVEGDSRRLYEWFLEQIPEASRSGVPIEAFSGMIMQTDPKEIKINLDRFLEGVENNVDLNDTKEKLISSIRKHLAR